MKNFNSLEKPFVYDNDLHIHSKLSSCSNDEQQTTQRILEYAIKNNLKTICLTDHFWDEKVEGASRWYTPQNFGHISKALPLPQADGIEFLFGCETEMDKFFTLGIAKESFDKFDFIVVPTTHLHMMDFTIASQDNSYERRAKLWIERFDALLNMDLPFYKMGLAHITSSFIAPTRAEYLEVLKLIPESQMERLFIKAANVGIGIELNLSVFKLAGENEIVLKPYRIAKKCGCKFYCGSDAHSPKHLDEAKEVFEKTIDILNLTENDKFYITKK